MENNELVQNIINKKDIEFLKQGMGELKAAVEKVSDKLETMNDNFVKRSEHDDAIKELKECLDKKVDKEEFDPIKLTLRNINWLLISAIVIAILAVVGLKAL